MAAIKPRDGEHPLATKCRMLHRELARIYGAVWIAGIVLIAAQNYGGPQLALGVSLLILAVGTLFGVLAISHYRWSR